MKQKCINLKLIVLTILLNAIASAKKHWIKSSLLQNMKYFKAITIIILLFMSKLTLVDAQAYAIDKGTKALSADSQMIDKFTILDTANIIVTYKLFFVIDPQKADDKSDDIQILKIGKRISKTYSKYVYDNDSVCTIWVKRGKMAVPGLKEETLPVEIYKNYPETKSTLNYRIYGTTDIYTYNEPFPIDFKWQLTNETKKIQSYDCQKATTTYAGRDYEAWFTNEIPIHDGPYKFSGLPGLILEIYDTQNHYHFTCIGIERLKNPTPIKYYKWRYVSISKPKLLQIIKQSCSRPKQYLSALKWEVFVYDPSTKTLDTNPTDNISFPCNPIELK